MHFLHLLHLPLTMLSTERTLLARICTLLGPHQPQAPAPTESNPHPLPPIHLRLPPNSPAISHGTLDQAMKGGGLGGMLGGMFGGEDEEAIEKAKRDKEEEDRKKREQMQKMLKPKKVHIKRRR